MDAKRTRRLLIVAFALSLLLHLIISGLIRWPFRPPEEAEVQVVRLVHVRTLRIARAPKPPPHTPAPAATHRPVRMPKLIASTGPGGNASGAASAPPAATSTPAPTPVPTPNCTANDTPVEVIATPAPPDIDAAARGDRVSGIAQVQVTVGASGNVENASVLQSSGSSPLDLVAVNMARSAEYAPATHACKAITAIYTFRVRFIAW